jgi:hypothetical protein
MEVPMYESDALLARLQTARSTVSRIANDAAREIGRMLDKPLLPTDAEMARVISAAMAPLVAALEHSLVAEHEARRSLHAAIAHANEMSGVNPNTIQIP